MRRMLKYQIPVDDQWHEHAAGADGFAHVGHQAEGFVTLWSVDLENSGVRTVWLRVFGTGQEIPSNGQYVGTALEPHGLVWHLFKCDTPLTTDSAPTEENQA